MGAGALKKIKDEVKRDWSAEMAFNIQSEECFFQTRPPARTLEWIVNKKSLHSVREIALVPSHEE